MTISSLCFLKKTIQTLPIIISISFLIFTLNTTVIQKKTELVSRNQFQRVIHHVAAAAAAAGGLLFSRRRRLRRETRHRRRRLDEVLIPSPQQQKIGLNPRASVENIWVVFVTVCSWK